MQEITQKSFFLSFFPPQAAYKSHRIRKVLSPTVCVFGAKAAKPYGKPGHIFICYKTYLSALRTQGCVLCIPAIGHVSEDHAPSVEVNGRQVSQQTANRQRGVRWGVG